MWTHRTKILGGPRYIWPTTLQRPYKQSLFHTDACHIRYTH